MPEAKLFSMKEIKEHNDNKSTWVVIHNSVYDVTAFLNEHPGGEEVLLEQSGQDATEAFEDVGHSSDARELMGQYKIGELVEEERVKTEKKNPYWASSSDPSNKDSSWNPWVAAIVIGLIAIAIYTYYPAK